MGRPSSNAPERLLDAAEAVILKSGASGLTLDAVAAEAGMSKGGLLHHLPTKEKLIEALVQRCASQLAQSFQAAYDSAAEGPARLSRGLIEQMSEAHVWSETMRGTSLAIVAALATTPELIQPLRDVYTDLYKKLEDDGLQPGFAEALVAATDGLWLLWLLGLLPTSEALISKVQAALRFLVEQSVNVNGADAPTPENS